MSLCWTVLLPLLFAFIFFVPCTLYSFDSLPSNISILSSVPVMFVKKDSFNKEKLLKIPELVDSEDDDNLAYLTVNSVYTNLNEKSTIDKIKKDLKEVSGIYAIMYNETKQLYIGSSWNLAKRIFEHIFNIGSSNIHLQRAVEKYGLNNFSVYILEILFKDNENQ